MASRFLQMQRFNSPDAPKDSRAGIARFSWKFNAFTFALARVHATLALARALEAKVLILRK